jgi:hypothetical protein
MEQMVAEPRLTENMVRGLDVWAASLMDRPGALAEKLTALKEVGADLEFIIARRSPDRPGAGVVFVSPIRGDQEIAAAVEAGFNVSRNLHGVRVEGPDRPGLAAHLTQSLAAEGISLRGFSAAVAGTRFIAYIALDSLAVKDRAIEILKTA